MLFIRERFFYHSIPQFPHISPYSTHIHTGVHIRTHTHTNTHTHFNHLIWGQWWGRKTKRIWTRRDLWKSTLCCSLHSPGWPSARERIVIEMRSKELKKPLPRVSKCSDPRVVLGLSGLKSLKINWGASIYWPMRAQGFSVSSPVLRATRSLDRGTGSLKRMS